MTVARPQAQEPLPAPPPERPLVPRRNVAQWTRDNLFGSWFDTVLTVVLALVLGWLVYRLGRLVLVDARWEIVERNITNIMVSRYPREELGRLWVALFVLAAALGLGAGVAAAGRRREVEEGRARPPERGLALRRAGPAIVLVGVLLWFARSPGPVLYVLGIAAVAVAAYLAGRRLPQRAARFAPLIGVAGIVAAYLVVTAFGGVGWSRWGGLLLTIFLAVGGIVISFPLGVLLALGRRSSFPAVRIVCVAYIELIRGVPLITLLFMGAFMLGFFLPPGFERPSLVTRALVAIVLFTAAYVAEVVRGGLQGVPRGQIEAAQALGLSPIRITGLIVLPQALRSVIPALVGQFISLFKDTSLVVVIGLTDLLGIARNITAQPEFLAQGLIVETLLFAAFVYWAGSYWMSRESQRLERRLGLGER